MKIVSVLSSASFRFFINAGVFYIAYVSDLFQNLIFQHFSIGAFLKYYLDRDLNICTIRVYRGLDLEKKLMKFIRLMSRSIDSRRPREIITE
jgi:hypothetical protein